MVLNMAIEHLFYLISRHPEGFTYYFLRGKPIYAPTKGYVIAIDSFDPIKNMNYTGYLGGWHDSENNEYLIETVLIELDFNRALELGKKFNQRYIYDLYRQKTISVTGGP